MIIAPGRSRGRTLAAAHSRRLAVARLRGGCAGAMSAALSIAAHGWASGGMPVSSGTLTLVLAAASVVGALVTGLGLATPGARTVPLAGALLGGQLLGHATLTLDMAGMPHRSAWTPAMLAAHAVAALAAALLIRSAEAAYRIGCAAVARVLPILLRTPATAPPPRLPIAHRARVILRLFPADTFRTRGPPATAAL
ncbi:hypothetical protein [Nocardia sp. alder85J]|uniref:hypothetical protein n=1 Tax=Nocardia sp. alder85J TaxID=2862949 RepID=UPI001CD21B9D|nr:hypothetical protein [Nocardia sp. alder85J]MCX4096971.1 hypothetical protein [Nocardia sp. alder85J]